MAVQADRLLEPTQPRLPIQEMERGEAGMGEEDESPSKLP